MNYNLTVSKKKKNNIIIIRTFTFSTSLTTNFMKHQHYMIPKCSLSPLVETLYLQQGQTITSLSNFLYKITLVNWFSLDPQHLIQS